MRAGDIQERENEKLKMENEKLKLKRSERRKQRGAATNLSRMNAELRRVAGCGVRWQVWEGVWCFSGILLTPRL
jgi:hypothetical protein